MVHGMRAKRDEAGILHLPHHRPVQVALDHASDLATDEEEDGLLSIALENGKCVLIDAQTAVVERQDDRVSGKSRLSHPRCHPVVESDGREVVVLQILHLLGKLFRCHKERELGSIHASRVSCNLMVHENGNTEVGIDVGGDCRGSLECRGRAWRLRTVRVWVTRVRPVREGRATTSQENYDKHEQDCQQSNVSSHSAYCSVQCKPHNVTKVTPDECMPVRHC